jgi:hypothetical protein
LLMYLEIGYLESTTDNLNFLVEKWLHTRDKFWRPCLGSDEVPEGVQMKQMIPKMRRREMIYSFISCSLSQYLLTVDDDWSNTWVV